MEKDNQDNDDKQEASWVLLKLCCNGLSSSKYVRRYFSSVLPRKSRRSKESREFGPQSAVSSFTTLHTDRVFNGPSRFRENDWCSTVSSSRPHRSFNYYLHRCDAVVSSPLLVKKKKDPVRIDICGAVK
ncbi:hypothetical protein QN277_000356 [Acacia crassicarpa]|uniref:Uncharacterized protein n=1 Tax=Acacia crassicarpa TaxID=499986 RepID=A0AAE1N562_9FABA|nr:hypothetical protein QN277_000356 [Acacia crassicarpa]